MIISILGSGWLGLPLANHFIEAGHTVKASTTSQNRLHELRQAGIHPFLINIDSLTNNIGDFLQADILIVNIPSKNVAGFRHLVSELATSNIQNILFVSSTSVYQNVRRIMTEADTDFYSSSPLLDIEELFQRWSNDRTTIVRFGGLIGYSRQPGRFFKSGRIVQNPDAPVNLIHRDDCIGMISQLIEQGVWGEVFNCCATTHPTKREFYTRAAALIGTAPPQFGESNSEVGKQISNKKITQRLNYQFQHPNLMEIEFRETP